MAFRNNDEIKGYFAGGFIRLDKVLTVLDGEFTKGSILRIDKVDDREEGELKCTDLDSGRLVYVNIEVDSFTPCENPSSNIERQIPNRIEPTLKINGDPVKFVQWLAKFLYELTTEVSPSEKIVGFENLLIEAFNKGFKPSDSELISVIPFKGRDPEIEDRYQKNISSIKNPFLKERISF